MIKAGEVIADRYEVIEPLASGGMGTLWRAHHRELDVDVALKVISTGAATPSALKRFKREAQAAARLRGPNIVRVHDFGVFEDQPFLVMELLQGEDLASLLLRVGKLSVDEAQGIIDEVANAVSLAHEADIVHRDLKPANIFLEQVGGKRLVKILDFGIAKDLRAENEPGSTTQVGALGSPSYMSPEQVWSQTVVHQTDVWGMGVVLFEMLTGTNPFADDSLAKVFDRIVRDPLPKPSAFDPGLPRTLDGFFEHAFAREVSKRIPSAADFAAEFRDAANGIGSERPVSVSAETEKVRRDPRLAETDRRGERERREPPSAKRRWAIAGVAIVLLLAAALFFGGRPTEESSDSTPIQHLKSESGALAEPPRTAVATTSKVERAPSSAPERSENGNSATTAATAVKVAPRPSSAGTQRTTSGVTPLASGSARTGTPVPSAAGRTAASPAIDPKFGIPVGH